MEDIADRMMQLSTDGYCCAQIMLSLALETQHRTNPDLIRAAGGLCFGIGSGEACGALAGGMCILSLYAGKGESGDEMDERCPLMIHDLAEWFREMSGKSYGGVRCNEILANYPDKSVCPRIVMATYGKTMEILKSFGFDLRNRRND